MSVQSIGCYPILKTNHIYNANQSVNTFTPLFQMNSANNTPVP